MIGFCLGLSMRSLVSSSIPGLSVPFRADMTVTVDTTTLTADIGPTDHRAITVTITHASSPATDRTFALAVLGG